MNSRRELLMVLGTAALAPRAVFAQARQTPVLIALLHAGSRESFVQLHTAFSEGLAALGVNEGSQVTARPPRGREGRSSSVMRSGVEGSSACGARTGIPF